MNYHDISRMIDHALLSPRLTAADLDAGIDLALRYEVASACIMPYALRHCAERLSGTGVKASTTIGFPHGSQPTSVKQFEAEHAIANGCEELDMVVNISQVLSGAWDAVRTDIQAVIAPAHAAGRKVKVIFETCDLLNDHKRRLCDICGELNADWVKTSTGFSTQGATLADVQLMRACSPPHVQVKAAGGVRTFDDLLAFRTAGATRIGTSKTRELLEACRTRLSLPPLSASGVSTTGY
ncbi:deoxyribose-phosphate aldolase [Planctomicrobium piriforme]|uniref:Deoxyribose-phosphate aldolase n=1 Tax=Planctomicrobium piriforme TaxID=1576369 RepID=A0A1I3LMM2_9PLAN|nr:deoxyribose-phosphate aldolase [Planctomicrobium piriforme]SFI85735.1 deoxyribose-phosphate aldolase [Planctomicrobium piriforme]